MIHFKVCNWVYAIIIIVVFGAAHATDELVHKAFIFFRPQGGWQIHKQGTVSINSGLLFD